jgi:hypothetical protein
MRRILAVSLLLLLAPAATAQHPHTHSVDRVVDFPDVPGYQTLACDFHLHTVFSDGSVWPNIRVQEALRDGLDCIAVTDHLEYQPHADDLPHPDRNRSYDLAAASAAGHDLIVLRGSEITRDMPPGHANAIFIQDANRLLVADSVAAFQEAARQGAFTFWNHPNWTRQRPDGLATLTDLHRRLIQDGLLDGIEVANDLTYSDEALQIALDHDLALLGTSDIHGLVDWQFEVPEGGHRPVTLVFAEARSAEGIRAALDARRTTVWFDNTLVGRPEHLVPLIDASLSVASAVYDGTSSVLEVAIENTSDAAFLLRNRTGYTFHAAADVVTVAPRTTTRLAVKTGERLAELDLVFEVLNAVTAPNTHPEITLHLAVQ